jgi:hypothetical protein
MGMWLASVSVIALVDTASWDRGPRFIARMLA